MMQNYNKPNFESVGNSKFELVFAMKSGHQDNGNGHSAGQGNVFGDPSGNNDKHKH